MPIQTDVLETVFAVKGITSLIAAFEADGVAQKQLAAIEAQVNAARAAGNVSLALQESLFKAGANAAQAAAVAQATLLAMIAGAAVKAFQSLVSALHDAVDAYTEFGAQVMTVHDLTGASLRESAQAAELFRTAGIKDTQAIRDYLRLSHDLLSAQGRQGLSMIGISPEAGESGIHLFNRIIEKLNQIPPGLQRSLAMEELFGARGAVALEPLLRMTEQQRAAALALGDAFDTKALGAVQDFQASVALLGQTVLVELVYPLAQALLPVLNEVVKIFTTITNWFGHIPGWLRGVIGIAGAFAAIGTAISGVMLVIPPLIAALRSIAIVEAIIDALSGQWQNLIAGAAVGVAAGVSLYGIGQLTGGDSPANANTSALNSNTESNLRVAGAMDRFNDNWQQYNRGGVPRGLQRGDIAELTRQQRLRTVG